MPVFYNGVEDEPVEIAPGGGDMRFSSATVDLLGWDTVALSNGFLSHAQIFERQAWVSTAVMRMLTWAVRVPLKAYRRTGDDSRERLRPGDHPIADLIDRPWGSDSTAQLTQALLGPLLVEGNSTVLVKDGAGGKLQAEAIDWRQMRPIQERIDRIDGWTRQVLGQKSRLSVDDVLHVRWWSPLGAIGISPLTQLGTTLKIEDAAKQWQVSMLEQGARPPSAIKASDELLGTDKDIRAQVIDELNAAIRKHLAGPLQAGKPFVMPPGFEWEQIGHTAVEAELIDQRKVAREEIAAIYQIPPPMLGILDRATFSNITELRQVAYTDGLGPPLVLIEQAITSQVIRNLLREDDVYVEFDFAGVLRGDRLKEIQALRGGIESALFTPEEGRSILNLPSIDVPDAKKLWLQKSNLQPLGDTPDTVAAQSPSALLSEPTVEDDGAPEPPDDPSS